MDQALYYLIPAFLAVSLVYAMTGQGGGTAYLALLALFGVSYNNLPSISLACNIVATVGIVYHFHKEGHLKLRLTVPFIITSIPAAFIGGTLFIPETTFRIILICVLFVVSIGTFFWKAQAKEIALPSIKKAYIIGPIIGIALGLLAGMIGIGGGVFLLPIIVFLRWGNIKQGAVAGGFFTLVNSLSGLVGQGARGVIDWTVLLPLLVTAVIGSQIGAHLGAKRLSAKIVQKVFAVILLGVAVRLLIDLLY